MDVEEGVHGYGATAQRHQCMQMEVQSGAWAGMHGRWGGGGRGAGERESGVVAVLRRVGGFAAVSERFEVPGLPVVHVPDRFVSLGSVGYGGHQGWRRWLAYGARVRVSSCGLL